MPDTFSERVAQQRYNLNVSNRKRGITLGLTCSHKIQAVVVMVGEADDADNLSMETLSTSDHTPGYNAVGCWSTTRNPRRCVRDSTGLLYRTNDDFQIRHRKGGWQRRRPGLKSGTVIGEQLIILPYSSSLASFMSGAE